jgi:hypothetical protein
MYENNVNEYEGVGGIIYVYDDRNQCFRIKRFSDLWKLFVRDLLV